ncbi:protein Skeletor, isoforms B/C [Ischnura elegans]|uniref:protein Skeletor, isoforms B/C n=1 Tax=Ischnura elegans TaxID=197161 RepID=UPI001ED8A3A5|nr:protein Skeletor, isoforms B/C [Ischnura elegans]
MGTHGASRRPTLLAFVAALCALLVNEATAATGYYGKFLGKLNTLHHSVSGDVYAVDSRTLHIRDFTYDGEAPDAFFYAGTSKVPSGSGFRIRDEKGTLNVLGKYNKKHVTLTLPEGKTLSNIRWFSVWCREFEVNFADVKIPAGFDFPKPIKIGALGAGVHGVKSDPITIVDAQTLLVPNFSYDGEAPDAKFWVGPGSKPNSQGIRVADENGKLGTPLKRYDRRTLVLTLPGDLTVFDIGHFGVWCEAFAVDFGHVAIPKGPPPPNVPPSLRMLGVSPQSKLNCEVLWDQDGFEVRWAVAGHSLVMQLVAKLDTEEYMSFGVSGDIEHSKMIGGDVVVAWLDNETLQGRVQDYYLDAKSQCSGSRGSCPDIRLPDGTESVRLLSAARSDGHTVITYQRPLVAVDNELDRRIYSNGTKQPFIWAIGPLNARNEVSYHRIANRHDVLLDFGRYPEWNCPKSDSGWVGSTEGEVEDGQISGTEEEVYKEEITAVDEPHKLIERPSEVQTPRPAPKVNAWKIPPIPCYEPDDGVYYAQMGPTGGKRGYPAITGHVGWGISWYINGLLIPEINVVRGRTYTFVVEGGADPDTPARYHPLYITDDPIGGYEHKTDAERAGVQVFAGVEWDPNTGEPRPTATGRLCNWTPDPDKPADEATSFGAYQRTLSLVCDEQNDGRPGILRWTPDINTPDTVYYQCYTHRYLGWKINVLDSCEGDEGTGHVTHRQPQRRPASRRGRGRVAVNEDASQFDDAESLVPRASILVSTRVRPDEVGVGIKTDEIHNSKPKQLVKLVENNMNVSLVEPELALESGVPSLDLTVPPTPGVSEKVLLPESKNIRQVVSSFRRYQHQPGSSYTFPKRFQPSSNPVLNYDRRGVQLRGNSHPSRPSFGSNGEGSKRVTTSFSPSPPVNEGNFRPVSGSERIDVPVKVLPRRAPPSLFPIKTKKKKIGNLFGRQNTESLEPIFIPSPPDLIAQRENITSIKREDVNIHEEETKMAANERVDSYSLPPRSHSSPVVSYDGKQIDPSLTSVVSPDREGNSRSRRPSSAKIQSTPQFGPFLGEVPPPVPVDVVPSSLPQLRSSNVANKRVSSGLEHPPSLNPSPRSQYSTLRGLVRADDSQKIGKTYSHAGHHKFSPESSARKSHPHEERGRSRRDANPHHEPGHDHDDTHNHNEDHEKMNAESKKSTEKMDSKSSATISSASICILILLNMNVWWLG